MKHKSKILDWKRKNKLQWGEVEKLFGMTRQNVGYVIRNKSSKISVKTALKIKLATGLEFWDFIDGLDTIKKLSKKNNK